MIDIHDLRRDICYLGRELGMVIRDHQGEETYDLIEQVRHTARRLRTLDPWEPKELMGMIERCSLDELEELIKAFSAFFDLANLAEDRHRIRVLRELGRPRAKPVEGSFEAVFDELIQAGRSVDEIVEAVESLDIQLVFTAHPTEAKRRTTRKILNRLRDDIRDLHRSSLTAEERDELIQNIHQDVLSLMNTASLRSTPPTVDQEVDRGLSVARQLWAVVPQVSRRLDRALPRQSESPPLWAPVKYGSWIGGDRDGHPFVTVEVTRRTLKRLRQEALQLHIHSADELESRLTVEENSPEVVKSLLEKVYSFSSQDENLQSVVQRFGDQAAYRGYVYYLRWRLEQTEAETKFAYSDVEEFRQDLDDLDQALREDGFEVLANRGLLDWRRNAKVFSFHLQALDIRQNSASLHEVADELMRVLKIHSAYASLSADERLDLLIPDTAPEQVKGFGQESLSPATVEWVELMKLIAGMVQNRQAERMGYLIISMTEHPGDVMVMRWLYRLGCLLQGIEDPRPLPISPLFETLTDLENAPDILNRLLDIPEYRREVEFFGKRQMCMLGYSDSAKDGGFLAANWHLYRAQEKLAASVKDQKIDLVFFHGRGGALGRGGGPASRAIHSLPPDTFRGAIRITEQGEVIATRYDDQSIACRHLEQLTSACVSTLLCPADPPDESYRSLMDRWAEKSSQRYRDLIAHPDFIEYFECATPINGIEKLQIGSRPSRRTAQRNLNTLRAIPYTFAWTQSRQLITGFFGVGTDWEELFDAELSPADMYQSWNFFQAVVDNAEIALAKSDMGVAKLYAGPLIKSEVFTRIQDEAVSGQKLVCEAKGVTALLDRTKWLQNGIRLRNPYIDVLNVIQCVLMKTIQESPESPESEEVDEALAHLLRLSIQGVAAGMRTTG